MDDNGKILAEALSWTKAGRKTALATVVSSWGSSPRAAGSRLAVDGDGHFIGSVSGGCVEGEVLARAEEVLASGRPALLEFGVSDERAWSVGLACGGAIRVFVERVADLAFFDSIAEGLAQGEATVSLVDLASGARATPDAWAFDAQATTGHPNRAGWRPRRSGRDGAGTFLSRILAPAVAAVHRRRRAYRASPCADRRRCGL